MRSELSDAADEDGKAEDGRSDLLYDCHAMLGVGVHRRCGSLGDRCHNIRVGENSQVKMAKFISKFISSFYSIRPRRNSTTIMFCAASRHNKLFPAIIELLPAKYSHITC